MCGFLRLLFCSTGLGLFLCQYCVVLVITLCSHSYKSGIMMLPAYYSSKLLWVFRIFCASIWFLRLKNHLKGRQRKVERDWERESYMKLYKPYTVLLSNCPLWPGLVWAKARSKQLHPVSHGGGWDSSTWIIFCCLPQWALAGSCIGRANGQKSQALKHRIWMSNIMA